MPNVLQINVASKHAINQAWVDLYARSSAQSRKTIGNDGQSINDFNSDIKKNLLNVQRALRPGSYRFHTLRPYVIPKPNGKYRVICVPTVQDRIVQRSLLNYLSEQYGPRLANGVSYGFIRGRTVADAAKMACALRRAHPWVLKTDITSFFDRISRDVLMNAAQRLIRQRSLHPLLEDAIHCEIETQQLSTKRRIKQLGIEQGIGVRQGMPLSPFFANVYLIGFDRWLEAQRVSAIRYADDLIFFLDSEVNCQRLASNCASELEKLGLNIPAFGDNSKSVIYTPDEAAEFLGLGLKRKEKGYALEVMPDQIERIKAEMRQFASVKEMNSRGITLASLGHRLVSMQNGYLAAYDCCSNIVELERNMSDVSTNALRTLYQRDLGINLERLSKDARTFLMI